VRSLRAWLARLAGLLGGARRDADFSEELAAHLQLHIDDNLRSGMTLSEARRDALLKLGGLDQVKERTRDRRGLPGIDMLVRDVRLAARALRARPGFTTVAVLTLALGIGVNGVLFTLVNAALFRPLPVDRPDELVDVYTSRIGGDIGGPSSYPDYLDMRAAASPLFAGSFGYAAALAPLAVGGRVRLVLGEAVTGEYFRTLGIRASIGRGLEPTDDQPGADRVVVVSHGFWQRELGGQRDALGTTIRLRDDLYTVVGVAPESFRGMVPVLEPQFWKAMAWLGEDEAIGVVETVPSPGNRTLERRGARWMYMRARLLPGETAERVQAVVQTTMDRLARTYPTTNGGRRATVFRTSDVRVLPGPDTFIRLGAIGLLSGGALILLVVCANVSGMLLVRAAGRVREFSLRVALGASRGRLVQQVLVESLLLSGAGASLGLWLAWIFARTAKPVSGLLPFPVGMPLSIDARVVGFTVAAAILAAVTSALIPAWHATRVNPADRLKGSRGTNRIAFYRWTAGDGLAVLQVAVTVVLVLAAALVARGLSTARRTDPGFKPAGLVAVNPWLVGYDNRRTWEFYDRALSRVRQLPGVEAAALAGRLPMEVSWSNPPIFVPGVHSNEDQAVATEVTSISAGYFDTLGVPLIEGRDLTAADALPGAPRVAVVSAAMAERYWPNGAIGQRFRVLAWAGPEYQVVGVSADYKVRTIGEPPTPYVHFAASRGELLPALIIARTRGDADSLNRSMQRELLALEPNLVLADRGTVAEQIAALLLPVEAAARGLAAVAAVATFLALIGLYGVVASAAVRRRHEIGVRLALGAGPGQIRRMVLGRGLLVATAGIAAGAVPAFGVARVAASLVYGVAPLDPMVWLAAIALVLTLACLANDVPARQAARLDPSRVFRSE
jgi:predicted permease